MRKMKDSGIEWIGEIPAEWETIRIKNLFDYRNEKNSKPLEEVNLISLYTDLGVVQHQDLEATTGNKASTADGYKLVYKDDIVVNIILCWMGAIGRSAYSGVTSPAYDVYAPQEGTNSKFYHYLFRTQGFSGDCYKYGRGIMAMRWRTYSDQFRAIKVIAPPADEQERIVGFLDHQCAEIDSVIAKTKETIEEYKKLKQSIITEAVTKGIRGDRAMQDSNDEWIGTIPSSWETTRLKNIATSFTKGNGITKEDAVEDGDTPCVRYGEIYSKYNQAFTECVTRTNLSLISAPKYFTYGNILFTCTGELVEEIGKSIVYLGEGECLAGGDIIILKHSQHPAFLNYALNSHYAQAQKSCDKTKLKVVHISASDIGNILLALPPIAEQKEIADCLDEKCAEIDTLIEKKTALLEEMESCKKSVIYEYVTGKKEVL